MRAILFIVTFLSAVLLPFQFFLVFACIYTFVYSPLELFLIAILIDAQYGEVGIQTFWYAHTMTVAVLTIVSEVIKPHLSFYKT